MDREPETLTSRKLGAQSTEDSVAAGASARVGAILEKAEASSRAVREEAERQAQAIQQTARGDAARVAEHAQRSARGEAERRVGEISELRSSIAARAGSLVEGLEGAELTRARLDELVEALGKVADRLMAGIGGEEPDGPTHAQSATAAPFGDRGRVEASPSVAPLPEGAPIARRPTRARTARFAAVLMAIQGGAREDVAAHLVREYDVDDCDRLLDDVFGRTEAPA